MPYQTHEEMATARLFRLVDECEIMLVLLKQATKPFDGMSARDIELFYDVALASEKKHSLAFVVIARQIIARIEGE